MATSWRLSAGQLLQRRQWDGECVLYNDLSGDTHLLNTDALTLLLTLQAGPADGAVLHAALLAAGLPAVATVDLHALLDELAQLALVEPAC